MDILRERFEERYSEIVAYLNFLNAVDTAVKNGVPTVGGDAGVTITAEQQRILYSSVFLQLYNLVEATITGCLEAISDTSMKLANWNPGDLSDEMRKEWVRFVAKTHTEMGSEKRLESALELCEHLVGTLPVSPFEISRGGGGNWDDKHIEKIADRIGCRIVLPPNVRTGVKKPIRDELGAMGLIVSLRNKLAHGSLSFAECGQNDTSTELTLLAKNVAGYLRSVVSAFIKYLDEQKYIRPDRRNSQQQPTNS